MLIDLHAHSGFSKCCKADGETVLKATKDRGIDGVILTNHYTKIYLTDGITPLQLAEQYIREYYEVKKIGERLGLKVFFGVEISAEKCNSHLLLYGVEPEFLLKHAEIYDYELKDLYELAHKNNAILIQAHPFRWNINSLQNLDYLDGIEANCHMKCEGPHLEEVAKIAKENNKLLTCGGDFHYDSPRPKCGAYLPEDINDTKDVIKYLQEQNEFTLCVQVGKGEGDFVDFTFKKN